MVSQLLHRPTNVRLVTKRTSDKIDKVFGFVVPWRCSNWASSLTSSTTPVTIPRNFRSTDDDTPKFSEVVYDRLKVNVAKYELKGINILLVIAIFRRAG